jgi:dolichol-phosphate mannosyltransferase
MIMSEPTQTTPPHVSIVIAVHNEAGNIQPLVHEIETVLEQAPLVSGNYEIIFVDDGSTDSSAAEIRQSMTANKRIRLLANERKTGSSTSVRHGVQRARADWIMVCDGDGQNDPADMPRFFAAAWQADRTQNIIVCGTRPKRQDTLLKHISSRVANTIRQAILQDGCPDTACGFKLFRRETYLLIPFFNGLHRFMPALFQHYGHRLVNLPINDRPRLRGVSKSDILGRGLKGIIDMLGVVWLKLRTPRPQKVTEQH